MRTRAEVDAKRIDAETGEGDPMFDERYREGVSNALAWVLGDIDDCLSLGLDEDDD